MKFASPIPRCGCHGVVINAKKKAPVTRNPLRIDPTRTTTVRRQFMSNLRRRFQLLRKEIFNFVATLDALALDDRPAFVLMAQPREFQFLTQADKLKAFNEWLKQQMDAGILSPSLGGRVDQPWTAPYIESAYRRGILNAFLSTRQLEFGMEDANGENIGDQTIDEFMQSGFGAGETTSKIQLLATRSFEQLKGVTAAMSADMNRVMAQAIADGLGARDTANNLMASLDSLTRGRAMTIARTEIIHAHAEGQLDSFARLGVEQLGLKAEWATAGDDHVCPLCQERAGTIYTIATARGVIPLHPNCRCTWIPFIP